MSKGHTIPILHLSRLLLRHGAAVTIFTTPANHPFIANSLSGTNISIIDLPFPSHIDGVPPGIESTDKLPSMSTFPSFAIATKQMKPHFDKALENLQPRVTFMVTDGFLSWTLDSANKYGVPRLVFYGMNNYVAAVSKCVSENGLLMKAESDDEPFEVPAFPWIKLTRNDFSPPFTDREPKGPLFEFVKEAIIATSKSYGCVVNSFYELESVFVDFINKGNNTSLPKAFCVGPLCLAEPPRMKKPQNHHNPLWIEWLDRKLAQGKQVLYVAFGSQTEISKEQVKEIKLGLEKSQVCFLWVVKKDEDQEFSDGFEGRVKERGLVVKDWVDQREILAHESVQGFLSHCGWNSVMESICAQVPILAWPVTAEQPLNARLVVEELKIGLRIETWDGSVKGFVKAEGLEKMVRELMEGEMGKEVRKKVNEVGEAAKKAVDEGGSSWQALNDLINDLHANTNN